MRLLLALLCLAFALCGALMTNHTHAQAPEYDLVITNGTVIDGFTRDSAEIRRLGFPLFCRGRHMSDLLYHRTIIALNQPVLCGDVRVHPGDLILGGEDGILAVPKDHIDAVIDEAYAKSQTESKVRTALREGMSAGEAYRRFGVM